MQGNSCTLKITPAVRSYSQLHLGIGSPLTRVLSRWCSCLCLHVVDRIKEEPSADIQFPVLDENDEVTEADLLQLEGKCGSILQSEGKW